MKNVNRAKTVHFLWNKDTLHSAEYSGRAGTPCGINGKHFEPDSGSSSEIKSGKRKPIWEEYNNYWGDDCFEERLALRELTDERNGQTGGRTKLSVKVASLLKKNNSGIEIHAHISLSNLIPNILNRIPFSPGNLSSGRRMFKQI